MERVFDLPEGIVVPDGTRVHEILGPHRLAALGLPLVDGASVALGDLPAGTVSKIHLHPVVQQFAWVIEGQLSVVMKDQNANSSYRLEVPTGTGVLTEPGTFFQLINQAPSRCRVLYLVNPAFVFELNADGEVVYNDAIVLEEDWQALEDKQWRVPAADDVESWQAARLEALQRMRT